LTEGTIKRCDERKGQEQRVWQKEILKREGERRKNGLMKMRVFRRRGEGERIEFCYQLKRDKKEREKEVCMCASV
jgi:hypothetical protein